MPNHAAGPSPLPVDWEAVLDTMQSTLLTAIAATEPPAGAMPSPAETGRAGEKREELNRLGHSVLQTQERAERGQAIADEADQLLVATEAALQRRLADTESLRHRLAAWLERSAPKT
jgi:hypothetical protein